MGKRGRNLRKKKDEPAPGAAPGAATKRSLKKLHPTIPKGKTSLQGGDHPWANSGKD